MNVDKKKTGKKREVTLRFDLELIQPSDEATNEFSYVQLVKDEEKKDGETSTLDGSLLNDPLLQESDEDLVAIAKKFEKKYAPKKRKRVLHDSDLIDRGFGYDLTDSFVDDTEVYEDYVPHQLDTRFGGFYVNTGELEFKTAEDIEDDDELDFVKKKPKKPKVKKVPSFQTPQAILASQKLKKAKQRAALQKTPSVKKSQNGLSGPVTAGGTPVIKPPPLKKRKQSEPKCFFPKVEGGDEVTGSFPVNPLIEALTTSHQSSTPQDVIPTINLSTKLGKGSTGDLKLTAAGSVSNEVPTQQVPKEPPTLPDKLPTPVSCKVASLESMIVQDQGADGKLSNKARMSYDEHLVDIHLHCHGVSLKIRNGIFEYLAYKMGVARGTLVKRIKQELKKREDSEIEKCLLELKQAIDASMPEQIELHEKEVKALRAESISSQPEKIPEMDEESKLDDVFDETTGSANQPPLGSQEKTKRAPRKRFRWNEDIRKLLCAVVKVKVACEERMNRANKGNGEEIINTFLEEKVKPLWPKGWMQKGLLYKASEVAHKHFTNPQPKKVVPVKKEKLQIAAKRDQTSQSIVASSVGKNLSSAAGAAATSTGGGSSHLPPPSSGSMVGSLDRQFTSIKKELKKIKIASQSTNPGAGAILATMENSQGSGGSGLAKSVVVDARNITTAAAKIPHSKSSSVQSMDHVQTTKVSKSKPAAGPLSVSTTKQATTKMGAKIKPKGLISVGVGGKSQPATIANSVAFLLSANSLDVTQLLQAHLQQKSMSGGGGGGTLQLPVLASTHGSSTGQYIQIIPTTGTTKVSVSKDSTRSVVATNPASRGPVLTVVSNPQSTRVTPVVQPSMMQESVSAHLKKAETGQHFLPPPAVSQSQVILSSRDGGSTTTELESVISKVVSGIGTQKPFQGMKVPISVEPPTKTAPAPQLAKQQKELFTSPQVFLPAQNKVSSGTTTVITGGTVGYGPPNTASSGGGGGGPIVGHATPIMTQPPSTSFVDSSGVLLSVPDTPPLQSLPIAPAAAVVSKEGKQGESPVSSSPCQSPLKSPVEQIFEEHSYLGSNFCNSRPGD